MMFQLFVLFSLAFVHVGFLVRVFWSNSSTFLSASGSLSVDDWHRPRVLEDVDQAPRETVTIFLITLIFVASSPTDKIVVMGF